MVALWDKPFQLLEHSVELIIVVPILGLAVTLT